MRALSSAQLLDAWEQGASGSAVNRMLPLLAACAGEPPEAVAAWTIGDRDRRLLTVREWTFGSRLLSVAACCACREPVEWSIDTCEMPAASPDVSACGEQLLETDGYTIRFRMPNTLDLAAAARTGDVEAARQVLLDRCVIDVVDEGQQVRCELPDSLAESIATAMGRTDPGADTDVVLTCPTCGHRWAVLFDIESFFWHELSAWAQRTLKDVHALAVAYGWREADILNMGPQRRQIYLGLVGA